MSAKAMTVVPLSKLNSTLKRFAVKVRLEQGVSFAKYTKDGEEVEYMTGTGIDAAGDRISLAFFCPDVRAHSKKLTSGATVSNSYVVFLVCSSTCSLCCSSI